MYKNITEEEMQIVLRSALNIDYGVAHCDPG